MYTREERHTNVDDMSVCHMYFCLINTGRADMDAIQDACGVSRRDSAYVRPLVRSNRRPTNVKSYVDTSSSPIIIPTGTDWRSLCAPCVHRRCVLCRHCIQIARLISLHVHKFEFLDSTNHFPIFENRRQVHRGRRRHCSYGWQWRAEEAAGGPGSALNVN